MLIWSSLLNPVGWEVSKNLCEEDFRLILQSSDSDIILKLMRIDVSNMVRSSHISIDNLRGQINRAVRKMSKTVFPYGKLLSTSFLICFKTHCTFLIIEEYFSTVQHSSTSMYYIWSVDLLSVLKSLGEKVIKLLSLFQVSHKLF